MTKTIVAVVVTHNRLSLLKRCVESLLCQSYPCDILIIDNASNDGTESYVRQTLANQVEYYNPGSNLGGAGGFHIGMRLAVEKGYPYVWIMDDDCLPDEHALEKLMEADQLLGGPEHYGFLSSAVLWTDGQECVMNRQRIAKDYYNYLELMCHGVIRVVQATFVSLLFPAATIQRFGLPYKEYFIWGDDIEYTRRIAMRGGVPCFMVGQSQVVHAMKQNVGSDISIDDLSRMPRYRLSVRNEFFTYHRQGVRGVCLYYARCLRSLFWICTKSKDHRILRAATLFSGMIAGPFFRPKVEYLPNETNLE